MPTVGAEPSSTSTVAHGKPKGASSGSEQDRQATDIALSLVREFLARRKCTQTLQVLDAELPIRPAKTSTARIARQLRVVPLVKANKKKAVPFKTLVEVFASYFLSGQHLESSNTPHKSSSAADQAAPATEANQRLPEEEKLSARPATAPVVATPLTEDKDSNSPPTMTKPQRLAKLPSLSRGKRSLPPVSSSLPGIGSLANLPPRPSGLLESAGTTPPGSSNAANDEAKRSVLAAYPITKSPTRKEAAARKQQAAQSTSSSSSSTANANASTVTPSGGGRGGGGLLDLDELEAELGLSADSVPEEIDFGDLDSDVVGDTQSQDALSASNPTDAKGLPDKKKKKKKKKKKGGQKELRTKRWTTAELKGLAAAGVYGGKDEHTAASPPSPLETGAGRKMGFLSPSSQPPLEFGHGGPLTEQKRSQSTSMNDLAVEDFDDDFDGQPDDNDDDYAEDSMSGVPFGKITSSIKLPSACTSRGMSLQEAFRLRSLVFGPPNPRLKAFDKSWLDQGFQFVPAALIKNEPLRWGIVQNMGGPCGILACVQAYMVRFLMFGNDKKPTALKCDITSRQSSVTTAQLEGALVDALCHILWQAGGHKGCSVVIRESDHSQDAPSAVKIADGVYNSDNFTEHLTVIECSTFAGLRLLVANNLHMLQRDSSAGVVCFLYSVLLSRSLVGVATDKDDRTAPLIGAHGYCTQDMVNLALTGRAHTNVFDGEKALGQTKMRGISSRSSIGFLSHFEHFDYIQVGSNLKEPVFPIWVVCSESHYSVLFSTGSADKSAFDAFYYDGLAQQHHLIRLTIDCAPTSKELNPGCEDVVAPLNEVIRTKWKGALVDWNGSEPML